MEQIITRVKQAETTIARLLIAALEALGTIMVYAKITNQNIEQWNLGGSILLYLLLLFLYLLLLKERKE